MSLDYKQIELRLLAHFADVPTLQASFSNGEDIHTRTEIDVFGVNPEDVTPNLRRRATNTNTEVNFGIIYGISAFGLAHQLSIGNKAASQLISTDFARYLGIEDYMRTAIRQAREQGFVTNLMGRNVHILGINDKHVSSRQFAERQAINGPLQGSNADIIKRAMIKIHDFFFYNCIRLNFYCKFMMR